MYLAPHHFQAQGRFFEDSVNFVAGCFSPFHSGFLSLRIDEEDLRRGTFQVREACGVMPDGLVFDIADPRELPPRAIADDYPNTGEPLRLFLAVPEYRDGLRNVADATDSGDSDASRIRFRAYPSEVTDFNTGQNPKVVQLMQHNLRIALQREIGEHDQAIPLARIVRTGSGDFVLDPGYCPPCLRVSASPFLQARIQRLLEILIDKSNALAARRRQALLSEVRGDQRELAEFWLLHAINSAIPLLRLRKDGTSPHPADMYRALSQLSGALCTFAQQSEPFTLPEYDHNSIGECFAQLDDHIRRHLELGLPTNCITIPLDRLQSLFWGGALSDPRCFGKSRWIFGIRSNLPETTLITHVPGLVKISARDWIERVVRQAVPGVPITYMPSPPAAIHPQLETVYFSIDQNHRLFEPIRNARTIGIYVPAELANPELELHVVVGG
jgi:type VI secretion system protein ImpJ